MRNRSVSVLAGVEAYQQRNVLHKFPALWEFGEVTPIGARVQVIAGKDGGRLVPLREAKLNHAGRHALFHVAPGTHCIVFEYNDMYEGNRGYIWRLGSVMDIPPKPKTGQWMVRTAWELVNETKDGDADIWKYSYMVGITIEELNGALCAAKRKLDALVKPMPVWALDVKNPLPEVPPVDMLDLGNLLRTAPELNKGKTETESTKPVQQSPGGEKKSEPKQKEKKEIFKSFADLKKS